MEKNKPDLYIVVANPYKSHEVFIGYIFYGRKPYLKDARIDDLNPQRPGMFFLDAEAIKTTKVMARFYGRVMKG
jgi:hypothetical protein